MLNSYHPFYSINDRYRELFGEKIIKLAVDGGFTCPNRDGTLSSNGCIFCSGMGSGDFAGSRSKTITQQYYEMKEKMAAKWGYKKYIIYFQAFTNTYAPLNKLRALYEEALSLPDVVGIAIATRPDCIDSEKADYIAELSQRTYVSVELGLQTSNEKTAELINRCYENSVYEKALALLTRRNIDVVTHIIAGLPGESLEDIKNTVKFAVANGTSGIKLQLLHIIKDTELYRLYEQKPFHIMSLEEYTDIIVDIIEHIPQSIVVHRITGDGKKSTLFEPIWSLNKRLVLNTISRKFIERNTWQGKFYENF